jgi:hypothetical protein
LRQRLGITLCFMIIVMVLSAETAAATTTTLPPRPMVWEAGVREGQAYQELVFITGEPIVVTGTVTVRDGRARDNKVDSTYSYRLENREKEVKLDRQLTITTTWQEQGKEITAKNAVSRIRETVSVGRQRFTLDDKRSLLNASTVTLREPAVSYFAGNLEGRKVYTINRNEGEVVVEIRSDSTGYKQPWGTVEIQDVFGSINYDQIATERNRNPDGGTETSTIRTSWNGTFTCQASHSTKFDLQYIMNEPTQISFAGGFLKTETKEGILRVSYDLPRLNDERIPIGTRRHRGEQTINLTGTPKTERLPVPQYSDVRGRWSENDALLLGSLAAWGTENKYFHPTATVNRREFALALVRALKLRPEETSTNRASASQRNGSTPVSPYRDISAQDPDWPYLEIITKRGIMQGIAPGYFGCQGNITRAQAVTSFIRALGFENIGPGSAYHTGFADDGDIPIWARNSFSVARQIGLVSGDTFGRARPNTYLTREEAASMLARLVSYLRTEILRDYRDRIFLYR